MMDGYYMIGRHAECQIRPKSRSVSRRHCIVQHAGGKLRVFDLESTSGTRLNEQPVQPRIWIDLNHGDQLRCGKILFDVRLEVLDDDTADQSGNDAHQNDPGSGAQPSLVSGAALGEDDIAEFLSMADEDDRQERYASISKQHAHASDDRDTTATFDDIENTQEFDPADMDFAGGTDDGEDEDGGTDSGQDPWSAVASALPESDSNLDDSASSGNGQAASTQKNLAPPKKKKRSRSSGLPKPALQGSTWKIIGAAALLIVAVVAFASQLISMTSTNEPRIVRGIDD